MLVPVFCGVYVILWFIIIPDPMRASEYPYVLVLANTGRKPAHYASLFLLGIFLLIAISYIVTHLSIAQVPLIILMMGMIGSFYYQLNRKKNEAYPKLMWPIAIAGVCWFLLPHGFYVAIIYIICAIFENQTHIPVEIGLDDTGITFNHFPQKFYSWNSIQHLVIKDGLLTIDYTNNKIYQKELSDAVSLADEAEVNAYCKERLSK